MKGTGTLDVYHRPRTGRAGQRHRRVGLRPRCPATTTCASPPPARCSTRTPQEPYREAFIEDVRKALWASKVVAYSQGFDLIRTGGEEFGWNIIVLDWQRHLADGHHPRQAAGEHFGRRFRPGDPDPVPRLMAAPADRSRDR